MIARRTSSEASRSANASPSIRIRSRISSLDPRRSSALRLAQRFGRLGEQPLDDFGELVVERARLGAMAGEADGHGFIDPERLAEQQISGRSAASREARQEERARRFRDQSEIDERQREARALLGDHQVAVEQHSRADADAIAVDRRDQRGLALGEGAQQPPHGNFFEIGARGIEEIGEIVARREVGALAAQGDQPDRWIARRLLDGVGERGVHRDGDRVAALGPGQGDRQHRTGLLHPHVLAHRLSPLDITGYCRSNPPKPGPTQIHEVLRRHRRD